MIIQKILRIEGFSQRLFHNSRTYCLHKPRFYWNEFPEKVNITNVYLIRFFINL